MSTLDKILTFLAACVAALATADPIGLPTWVQVTAGILAVGFAAVGIYAPNPVSRNRAAPPRV